GVQPGQGCACGRSRQREGGDERRPRSHVSQQALAQVHAEKPSCVALGADGAPMTLPLESMRSICSGVCRFALAPLVLADVKAGLVRFGSATKPAFAPSSSGVSSIHSAVACVEL